jgi:hypothetical protein
MPQQIPIQLDLKAEQSFASFYTASHQEIIQQLTDTSSGADKQEGNLPRQSVGDYFPDVDYRN